jgi:hypothetical protein
MRLLYIKSIILTFLLPGSLAMAKDGSWAGGGGGEIIGDRANPWFLKNTKVIHTCIIVNPDLFHFPNNDLEVLKASAREAQAYWTAEFKKSYVVKDLLPLGTQRFDLVDTIVTQKNTPERNCPAATDLTYQFGYISSKQAGWLQTSGQVDGKVVATTVRTEYDDVQMKGKGFILLLPDSGSFALKFQNSRPWSTNPRTIAEVLKHELGHIYGLQHRGLGMNHVMAIDYAETILTNFSRDTSGSDWFSTPPYFGIEGEYTFRNYCASSPLRWGWKTLLKAHDHDVCTKFVYKNDEIKFYSGPTKDDLTLRGTLHLVHDAITRFTWEDAVRIFVTDQQQVFKIPEFNSGEGSYPLFVGPLIKINERHGKFYTSDGVYAADIDVRFNPSGIGFSKESFRVQTPTALYLNLDFEYGPAPRP